MAAVLSCGEGALLSHGSAAALWGFWHHAKPLIDVTVPGARRRSRSGLTLHGGLVHPEDCAVRERIPVTSIARTMLDLAAVIGQARLERAIAEAERSELFDLRAIERLWRRNRGCRGVSVLRAALETFQEVPETRSGLEHRFVTLCREANLPPPTVNRIVEGFEVDALWEKARLVVELDGYAFHRGRAAFERDRMRDAALMLAGYKVLRVTGRRLLDAPESLAATIQRLLTASQ